MNAKNHIATPTQKPFLICLLYILTLLASFNAIAQGGCMMVPLPLEQRIAQSQIIVEGKVISQESFWGDGRHNIFTRSKLQVYKVFKGTVSLGTIEIVTQGGRVDDVAQVLSANVELRTGDVGIFMCIPNPYKESGGAGYTPYGSAQGFIVYDTDNGSAHDPFGTYDNIENVLYDAIKAKTRQPVREVTPNPYLEMQRRRGGDNNNSNNRNILATPTITSFTPTSVASGTTTTITITGTNFGATQGTGYVEFKNANDGGGTWIKPLTTDYVSWTATQIVVKVPSTGISGPGAGTGQIRVTNSDPATVTSASTLTITYAYSNYAESNYARMPTHITDNSFGGYTFSMNTTFAANTSAASKMRAILNTWTCTSGINWLFGSTTAASSVSSDGINVVTVVPSLAAGVLASCSSWYYSCGSGASSSIYVGEIDVVISSAFSWYYGTSTTVPAGQYDFESVMLHEMGHGHQLNHVIDAAAVMHYAISSAQSKRTLNANEIAGANFVKNRDITIGTVCTSAAQMTLLACNAGTSAPVVTFTADRTNVVAGCTSVTFTSESAPETTSWSWNFGGGATSSTLQNPTIAFNTAGTYTVSLTATNAYGSTTFTRTSYIVVSAPICSATNTNFTGTPTDYTYTGGGQLIGHNVGGDLAFADKFTYCGVATKLTQLKYYFNLRTGTGNVLLKVWNADGIGGAPGTVLFSQTVAISALQGYPNPTTVTLGSPLSLTGDYYIGYQIVYSGSDAVSLVSNQQGQSATSSAWRMSSTSVWASYLALYGSSLSLKIEGVINNTPTATISPASATTFCNGGSVILNANSGAGYTYLWYKNAVTTGITTSSYTATTSGSYTVQVSYGTCAVTSSGTTVTVNACNDANLANLIVSSGTLAPAFAAATTTYTLSVPNATNSITVTPTVNDAGATVKVNTVTVASGSASSAIALNVGTNTITTVVTAQDGTTTKTYTITVTRAASSNADLSNLVVSTGTLSPAFGSATIAYTVSVPNATSSITVTPTVSDATATIKVNTVTVASGSASSPIALSVGSNTITTVVTAQDGTTTKTYTITVTRAASSNGNLSNLTVSTGTLTPVFAAATIAYTVSVPNATTSMTVTPTASDATAAIKVNTVTVASGSASSSIALNVGSNTITTVVTAQDGTTTKTYTITVTRAASSNANLSNLVISTGTLTPAFSTATLAYTVTVPFGTTSMTVTPTVSDATATIKVNTVTVASGSASSAIALNVGSNTITIVVTAQDGTTTQSYTISVTRTAPSTNANLSNLTVSTGTLSPAFSAATIAYTVSVPNATSSITVTPTLSDATATIKVNTVTVASGSASGSLPLNVGSNTISTVVTAQDGTTTKTYTITVTRAGSSNANLANLVISSGTLAPVFASATTAYTATVTNATSSITVTPTVSDATATVKVNTVTVASGSASAAIPLNVGSNVITTILTAQDGTTKAYTITVTRTASSNANLTNLTVSAGTLAPVFATSTVSYTVSVSNATTSMTVTPTLTDATATIKVNTVTVASGTSSASIPLNVGSNTITTVVTAQDGTTTKTYSITVTCAASSNANLTNLLISSGTLAPVFASATTSYAATVSNATSSITITPTASDATATIKVNAVTVTSGSASASIPLNVGSNTITTVVTAQDGTTTKTYTITVTRSSSSSVVNVNMYIQGYYIGGGLMNSVKFNQDNVSSSLLVEDLTVELHHATTYALVATTTATLKTDGTMVCTFNTAPSGSFYIVVKGRNMVQTWSATPQTVGAVALTYSFSNTASKAFGSNMVEVESGVWAFYTGDINQDEVVDGSDSTDLINDIENSAFGNLVTDLNGDGTVDNSDTTSYVNNAENSIFSVHP